MTRPTLPAIALMIATTLVYACTAAKAPTASGPAANGPVPTQSAAASTAHRELLTKLFARGNKASPKGDIKVAEVLKDDALGLTVSNFQMRVDPAKSMSTKSDHEEDAAATDGTAETPGGTDVAATPEPTPKPTSGDEADDADEVSSGSDQVAHANSPDDEEWDSDEWDTNSDPADDEWLDPEAKDDPEDIDAYGETDAAVGGRAPHHLVFHENDYPVMGEDEDSVTIEDQTAGKKKASFTADQDYLHFSATGASGRKLTVTLNPEGTYTVNDKPLPNARAAAQAIQDLIGDEDVTSETLAFVYATLKKRDAVISTLGFNCGMAGEAPASPTELVHEILALRLKK